MPPRCHPQSMFAEQDIRGPDPQSASRVLILGTYSIGWAGTAHGSRGAIDAVRPRALAVCSTDPSKGEPPSLRAHIAVRRGVIDEAVFEVGALNPRVVTFRHHEYAASVCAGFQVFRRMVTAIRQGDRDPHSRHLRLAGLTCPTNMYQFLC